MYRFHLNKVFTLFKVHMLTQHDSLSKLHALPLYYFFNEWNSTIILFCCICDFWLTFISRILFVTSCCQHGRKKRPVHINLFNLSRKLYTKLSCLPTPFSFPFQYLWFFQIIKELIYLLKPIREPENKVLAFTFNNHLDIRQTLGDFQFIKVQNYKCFILLRTAIN